jgi:hypothetical protein
MILALVLGITTAGCTEGKSERLYINAKELYDADPPRLNPVNEKDVLNVPIYPGAKTPPGLARVVLVKEGLASSLMTVSDPVERVQRFYAKSLKASKVTLSKSGSMIEGVGPDGKFVYITLSRKEGLTNIGISIYNDLPSVEDRPTAPNPVETTENQRGPTGPIGTG